MRPCHIQQTGQQAELSARLPVTKCSKHLQRHYVCPTRSRVIEPNRHIESLEELRAAASNELRDQSIDQLKEAAQ
jgi:hypothetical protein